MLTLLRFRVKLGVHEETGEQVAVKIMDKSDIRAQEMTMNVRREIAIMKALKHRNIVNLRQVLTSSSKLYIVMDLVTGGELFTKILNEGRLEENVARRYFQQLVDGIDYCHRRGVCHRDLKPENLLIDETTGELKITDFGLSAMKGASTTEELLHTQCGSPNYCAPEIIARHRQGYNGAKVDAWSCGIILFALLAGFLPFYDENTKVLYRMIQRDDVKFPRKFPAEAKDLVLRLLHKEPEKRFTLADVKKHPWFAVGYNGPEPRSGSSSSPPNSRIKKRRHRRTPSADHAPRSRPGSDNMPTPDKLAAVNAPAQTTTNQSVQQAPAAPAPTPQSQPAPVAPPPAPVSVSPQASPVVSTTTPLAQPPAPVVPSVAPMVLAAAAPTIVAAAPVVADPASIAPVIAAPVVVSPVLAPIPAASRGIPPPPPPMPNLVSPVHYMPHRVPPPVPPPAPVPRAQPVSPKHPTHSYPVASPNGVQAGVYLPIPAAPISKTSSETSAAYPGAGNTIANDSASNSLPEADPIYPSPPPFPTGLPMTSTSDVNFPSAASIPPAPRMEQVATGTTDAGRTELPLGAYSREPPPARSDTSWQRQAGAGISPPRTDSQPILVPNTVPMSFVEQRRAMYNNHSKDSPTAPAPLPDMSRGSAAAKWDARDMVAPKSTPLPDMSAGVPNWQSPVAMTRKISAPTMQRKFEELPMPFANGNVANGVHEEAKPEEKQVADPVPAPTPAPAPDTTFMIPEDAEEERENMKRRRAAALARYRRIFRLGNNVGIVGSPSFNSNNGNPMFAAKEDKSSAASVRAEFFSRAKAVTGAWGIILTQELEEESDSEDEGRQITEDELNAFGKLLDFWDNRRASAKISQSGEALLDDDTITPLSENEVLSIQSLLAKLEPKRVDDVEDVGDDSAQESEEIRQLLERDFSNPSVESGATPGSPRPRSVSNVEQSTKSGLRLSASVDVLPTRQKAPQPRPPTGPGGRAPLPPSQPNRKGAVFPPPPPYAPPTTVESSSQGRLTVTPSTVRDPFRPKLPPQYPSTTGTGVQDVLPLQARYEASKAVSAGGKIPQSVSMDDNLSTAFGRLSSNEKIGSERKKSSSGLDSESSVVGPKISQVRTPSRDEHATRGMFTFSMFRKKSSTSSSFEADLPLDKCLVEVGRILQHLGCSVMMKRGESKMKCEAPLNNERMLVSITCTHEKGTTKVVFKKGRKDRSRVDAKEFTDFFSTVYDKFLERLGEAEQTA